VKKLFLIFISLLIGLSGCGTFSLELESKMTQSIFLKNLQPKKSIYLVKTNTTSVDDNIGDLVKNKLIEKKYKFVTNPNDATYILRINTINMNAHKEQNEARAAAVTGASTGIVALAAKGGKEGVGGAIIGAVVGGIFAFAVADGQVRMQVDIVITEHMNDGSNLEYKTRIIAEAKQVHLTPKEGQPLLEKKISKQIAGIFL
jgi:hypothetical protein